MSLQPLGLNQPLADTIHALGNMTQAVEASEDRVQRSSNEMFSTMKAALEQSEKNNRLHSDRNAQLSERLVALENKNKELEAFRQAEKKASDDRFDALNQKVNALTLQLTQKADNTELENLRRRYNAHGHNLVIPNCGGIYNIYGRAFGTGAPNN